MNGDYQSLAPELKENLKMLAENRLCQTPEEVRELLEVNDKGQVKNTMQNVYQVFQSDPVLHGAIGYNILTGRIDICKPLWWERTTSAMSDTDFNYLMLYLEKRYGLNNENRIRRALTVVAHQNQGVSEPPGMGRHRAYPLCTSSLPGCRNLCVWHRSHAAVSVGSHSPGIQTGLQV